MQNRDRLIELLSVAVGDSNLISGEIKIVADYLIENGVIVLPCKVGNEVWVDCRTWGNTWNFKKQGEFLIGEIISIVKTRKQTLIKIQVEHNVEWERKRKRYPIGAIGKTVFLTKEEAEKSIKGD